MENVCEKKIFCVEFKKILFYVTLNEIIKCNQMSMKYVFIEFYAIIFIYLHFPLCSVFSKKFISLNFLKQEKE